MAVNLVELMARASNNKQRSNNFKDSGLVGCVKGGSYIGESGEMCLGAMVGPLPGMGRVFRYMRGYVLEAKQSMFDVSRHGHVARSVNIIPLEGEPEIAQPVPIKADLACCLQSGNEMVGIGAIGVPNAKVVNDKAGNDILTSRVVP